MYNKEFIDWAAVKYVKDLGLMHTKQLIETSRRHQAIVVSHLSTLMIGYSDTFCEETGSPPVFSHDEPDCRVDLAQRVAHKICGYSLEEQQVA